MLESSIDQYLNRRVKKLGGRAYKFVSPGNAGVPDRLVCFPGGHVCFVELKAPGKRPRPLQVAVQEHLKQLGFVVETIDSKEQVDGFLEYIKYQWDDWRDWSDKN